MRLEASRFALRLRTPLATSQGAISTREGWRVCIRAEGRVGLGEATPLPGFGSDGLARCQGALTQAAARLAGRAAPRSLEELTPLVDGALEGAFASASARHGVELALLDLLARGLGLTLRALLSAAPRASLEVNALLGERAEGALFEEAALRVRAGFRILKLKVGGVPLAVDLARLGRVREALAPGVRIRLDANGAWDEAQARTALTALAGEDIELCEQPVPALELDALIRLAKEAAIPIAADEALAIPGAAGRLLEAGGGVPVLVLKPMVLGGLLPARLLAQRAAAAGRRCYLTSSLDGEVARAGCAQLGASLQAPPLPCGLATGELLERPDRNGWLRPVGGALHLPQEPGLGLGPGENEPPPGAA